MSDISFAVRALTPLLTTPVQNVGILAGKMEAQAPKTMCFTPATAAYQKFIIPMAPKGQ